MDAEEYEEYSNFYYRSGLPENAPDALAYVVNPEILGQMTSHETEPLKYLFTNISVDRPDVVRGYKSVLENYLRNAR